MPNVPHTPRKILALQGTLRADRQGSREPEATGEPLRPATLDPIASELWDFLVPRLKTLELVGELDTHQLQAMCEWWSEYRRCQTQESAIVESLNRMAGALHEMADVAEKNRFGAKQYRDIAEAIGETVSAVGGALENRISRMRMAWDCFQKLAGKFGMTPADRAKLRDCGKPADANPMAQFLAMRASQLGSKTG